MSPVLHRRLLSGLVVILLVTAAVPATAVGATAEPPSATVSTSVADSSTAESASADEEANVTTSTDQSANATVSVHGLRTWTATGSADLSGLRDLREAEDSGNLTRSAVVARNDTLVLELRASGLAGAIAAEEGPNATARFVAFLNRSGASLDVYDLPGPEQQRAYLDVTDHSAVSVVPDPRNDSYYLAVETSEVNVTDGDGGTPANNRRPWGGHVANFTLRKSSAVTDGDRETATTEFRIEDAEATLDAPDETDRVLLAPGPNQTVSGRTTLAPGHRVTVEVRGPDGEIRSETVRVRNGTETAGRFAADFYLSGVPAGSNVEVWVGHDGDSLLDHYPHDATVPASVRLLDAAVNLTERGLTAQGVLVEDARLSHGGYLAVHRGSADGEVITRSQYLTPDDEFGQFVDYGPALESNATLVVVAHRAGPGDTLGEPYAENGSVVSDSVEFTVERETTTTTETTRRTTDLTTATDSTATTDSTTATTVETRTPYPQGDVPGFGVGAALVGLLAGLGLAGRRE
ncbi:BGTF surface domain-containing protein [Halorussus lipolyticus]|uniref:BGTF surface domain-containing protein n=1 Tax=Halorussus lipolyticus TaxID=3034024 RepID=UPI0023E80D38|nr:BGTF surface domain-containing protein [Halorussus sp. DT80]